MLLKSRLMPRGYKPRLHSHYTFKTIPVLLMRRKCTNKLSESQHFFLFPKFTININKHSSIPHQRPNNTLTINYKQSNIHHFQGQVFTRNNPFYSEKVFCFKYRSYFRVISNKQIFLEMAYVISDDCISCGACESECPVGAISMGDDHYQINADECISCGACAGVCPVGAPKEA